MKARCSSHSPLVWVDDFDGIGSVHTVRFGGGVTLLHQPLHWMSPLLPGLASGITRSAELDLLNWASLTANNRSVLRVKSAENSGTSDLTLSPA